MSTFSTKFLDKDGVNALWGKTCTTFSPKGHTHDYLPTDGVAIAAKDLVGRHEATYEEFTYRPSAGTKSIKDDNANIKSIYGSSLVYNQLVYNPDFSNNAEGWNAYMINSREYTKSLNNGILSYTYSNSSPVQYWGIRTPGIDYNVKIGEKLLIMSKYKVSCDIDNARVHPTYCSNAGNNNVTKYIEQNKWCTENTILSITEDGAPYFGVRVVEACSGTIDLAYLYVISLTRMFGAGNEPSTIEDFYARIPEGIDINAYNEGELINFTAESIKTTGLNQWDEQWEVGYIDASGNPVDGTSNIRSSNFIPVIGGATYYSKGGDCIIVCYDENKKFIPYNGETSTPVYTNCINVVNTTFVLPINTRYIKLWMAKTYGVTYNNDICINLSHSGIRDGEYEPYKEFTHDLSWIKKYFPNGMRSAGSAYDEIQYNESTQQWVAIKRIGEVDLGSLDWVVSDKGEMVVPLATAKKPAQGLCLKYNFEKTNSGSAENDKSFVLNTNSYNLRILDSDYTDVESFKEAMSGVKLYYELAEPVVTTITEILDTNYSVFDFGTEEILVGTTTINNKETGETNTVTLPSTSFKGNIVYAFNAVDRIRDIERNLNSLTDVLDDNEITNIFNEYFVLSRGSGGSGSGDSGDGISMALTDEANETEPTEPSEPIETTTEE